MTTYRVFRPTHDERLYENVALARRPGSLDGKRIGLLWNAKVNADVYLRRMRELLQARYRDLEFVWHAKPTASKPMEPELFESFRWCDAVITAFGD